MPENVSSYLGNFMNNAPIPKQNNPGTFVHLASSKSPYILQYFRLHVQNHLTDGQPLSRGVLLGLVTFLLPRFSIGLFLLLRFLVGLLLRSTFPWKLRVRSDKRPTWMHECEKQKTDHHGEGVQGIAVRFMVWDRVRGRGKPASKLGYAVEDSKL